jgi:hypothetical protein
VNPGAGTAAAPPERMRTPAVASAARLIQRMAAPPRF